MSVLVNILEEMELFYFLIFENRKNRILLLYRFLSLRSEENVIK